VGRNATEGSALLAGPEGKHRRRPGRPSGSQENSIFPNPILGKRRDKTKKGGETARKREPNYLADSHGTDINLLGLLARGGARKDNPQRRELGCPLESLKRCQKSRGKIEGDQKNLKPKDLVDPGREVEERDSEERKGGRPNEEGGMGRQAIFQQKAENFKT